MTEHTEFPATFAECGLAPAILSAVTAVGYETPSPIQAQSIPPLLQGRDILGVAQTGTGKTAAFALPLLSRLDEKQKSPQILVLAPTRELAIQVSEAFTTYGKHLKGLKVLPIYGGQSYSTQLRQLERGVQVIVGTPGRVMDHIRRGTLDLSALKALVLDEADEMLRMGFIDDVEWILEQISGDHQTALFSATMPSQIRRITKKYLHEPVEITIKVKTTTAETIRQRYWQVKGFEKLDVLTRILEVEDFDAVIVFVRTKNATVEVAEKLQARGYAAEALNGDIAQAQREKVVNRLKRGQLDILVATDVAARGLDVERISHVVNYDIPYDTESYVHRIGRTGRAGREGDAILFVTGRERNMLKAIEKATRQQIAKFRFPSADDMNQRKLEQFFTAINDELGKDISEYQSVMRQFMQQNQDIDAVDMAAAIASLYYQGKAFYMREQALPKEAAFSDKNDKRGKRDDKQRDKRKPGKKPPADMAFDTYRLAVGEKHGVGKGDIVGAIANEAGIDSQVMGKIRLYDEHSLIELPEGMPAALLKKLRGVWVRGKQLEIQPESPRGGDVRQPRKRKPADNKKAGGKPLKKTFNKKR